MVGSKLGVFESTKSCTVGNRMVVTEVGNREDIVGKSVIIIDGTDVAVWLMDGELLSVSDADVENEGVGVGKS